MFGRFLLFYFPELAADQLKFRESGQFYNPNTLQNSLQWGNGIGIYDIMHTYFCYFNIKVECGTLANLQMGDSVHKLTVYGLVHQNLLPAVLQIIKHAVLLQK